MNTPANINVRIALLEHNLTVKDLADYLQDSEDNIEKQLSEELPATKQFAIFGLIDDIALFNQLGKPANIRVRIELLRANLTVKDLADYLYYSEEYMNDLLATELPMSQQAVFEDIVDEIVRDKEFSEKLKSNRLQHV